MPIQNVGKLVQDLHSSGVLNTNTKISDVLKVAGVGELHPGSKVSSGAVAWDGYVIVYKGMPAGMEELQGIAAKKPVG